MSAPLSRSEIDERLDPLSRGWVAGHEGAARLFAGLFARHLGCQLQRPATGHDIFTFSLDLSRIRLKGMDEVHCMLAGGERPDSPDVIRSAVRASAVPGRIVLVLAANSTLARFVRAVTTEQRCAVLGIEELRSLLLDPNPVTFLKAELLRVLPPRSLIPYDILQSASGSMFFGRKQELGRLRDEDTTSFAIAGPGKSGKTSLIKQYQRSLREQGGNSAGATFVLDLMECDDKARTAIGYASFIANRIGIKEPLNTSEFISSLATLSKKLRQPVNLILDEADDLCLDDAASDMIAAAARNGSVRLILCGKGDLFRTVVFPRSHIANRLELLRLGPLEDGPARELLTEPLSDLGIRFVHTKHAADIVRFTGGFPHLIQLYAKRIAEHALHHGLRDLDIETLSHIQANDSEIVQCCLSPLQDFRDPKARLVALTLLRNGGDVWTPAEVTRLVGDMTVERARDLCDELVISNILTWYGGSYRLANQAVRLYSIRGGYLDNLYEDAQRPVPWTGKVRVGA